MLARLLNFSKSKISLDRPITSYSKVQMVYSSIIRNSRAQLKGIDLRELRYLNVGCGQHPQPGFVNLDYNWAPGIEVCWDLERAIPFLNESFEGVFSEHCLEHLPLATCRRVLGEIYRLLKPGGIARIVLPDAGLYLDLYQTRKAGHKGKFPFESNDPSQPATPMAFVNQVFRDHGHLYAYDFETLKTLLEETGFKSVEQTTFGLGKLSALVVDNEWRKSESLYVEAMK